MTAHTTATDTSGRRLPLTIDWDQPTATSRTELTAHMWAAPTLRRGTPTHDGAFNALRDLKADYVRFLSFWTHPGLSVPALHAPTEEGTSWDFSRLDPIVEDFVQASEGRPIVANFATIPAWMFKTPEPVVVDDDPDALNWTYELGTEFRDPTLTEVADYFERHARWYIAGGFHDDHGTWHESGHYYKFAYWEVLCEPDIGHALSPEVYTKLYDEVVKRLSPLDPDMKFIGLSLSPVTQNPEYFWYFLEPANHEPDIPLHAFSHHFYVSPELRDAVNPEANAPFEHWHATFFAQAEGFVHEVKLIESIKQRLSPQTATHINEIGSFTPDPLNPEPDIPEEYWALGGAVIAFLWSRLTELEIELVGAAEFMGYPGIIPGVSLVDWETGQPNARYQVVKLLNEHFGAGDTLLATGLGTETGPEPGVHAQAIRTSSGRRKVLLVNKYPDPAAVVFADSEEPVQVSTVDATTGAKPAVTTPVTQGTVRLDAFATAVVDLA